MTFSFKEDVNTFTEFIFFANWHDPIALFSSPELNTVNLVTSVAAKHGHALKLVRIDPVRTAKHAKDRLEMKAVNDSINENLLDQANICCHDVGMEYAKIENMAHSSKLPA